ncbi:MAG: thioredoxin domain-containing protein, partial [Pedosphaera parvula]|nr:thioredoxin domain-containing protein [Pedosphaera parvula]
REERPDVDKIYMSAVQAMGTGGGWPLNVFLTPDLKPFYGGTYFPPDGRYGRPSFLQVLQKITELWQQRREDLAQSAQQLHAHLVAAAAQESTNLLVLTPAVLHQAARAFKDEFDPRYGGFGNAPKFPRPSQPSFLLRHAARTNDADAQRMVLFTCERMAAGGMCDQLGGGFARYSVDAQWLVPHFEKMLYDNAQLIHLYLDAFLISGEQRHADVARDIIRYVLRDMTHPGGGFFSAEDADSEGHEGKFYCWTKEELNQLLTPAEAKVAIRYFGVTEEGNFTDHSNPSPLPNQNVLSIVDPKLAAEEGPLLASAKQKLLEARARRVRPHLDDKILASWNGLMLGAIARAYAVLGDEVYRAAAEKNLAFLQAKLWDADSKTLYHRWRDGERDNAQLLDDYAALLSGAIELYEATLEAKHLEYA